MIGQASAPSIRPLGGLPDLEEGESFVGYLARYAYELGLMPIGKVLDRVGLGDRPLYTNALEIHDPKTSEELRQLLGLDPAMFDRLRSWGTRPGVARVLGHDIPDVLVSVHGRRFCADCFRERPIHQARWDVIVLPGCSRHRTALRGACSACGTTFAWGSTGAPCCPSSACGLAFEEQAPGAVMGDNATEGSRLVEDLLREGVAAGSAPLSVGDTLTAASVVGTFLLGRRPQVVRRASKKDPVWLAEAMRAGLGALREWPHSFHTGLSVLQSRRDRYPGRFGFRKELGPFAYWVVQNRRTEVGRFFGEATDGWAADQPSFVTRTAGVLRRREGDPDKPYLLTTAQAAARLGVKQDTFWRFMTRSGFGGVQAEGKGSMLLVPSEDVEALAALQLDLVGGEEIAGILGVTAQMARALARAGLLRQFPGTEILDPLRPFSLDDARGLLARLESRVPASSRGPGRYSGREAARKMMGGTVALVRDTLRGRLVPVAVDDAAVGIDRIRYDSVGKIGSDAVDNGMISLRDVLKRLGASRNSVSGMMSAGLFEGINPDGRQRQGNRLVPLSAVASFERDYILLPEIGRRMRVPWRRVASRLSDLGLTPVSGPQVDGRTRLVFRRAEVEEVIEAHSAAHNGRD
jgi:predicted DNA-binding transcriptional regulator AlpA